MKFPCLFLPLGREENWLMTPTQSIKWNPAGTELLSWLSWHLPPHSQKVPTTSADRNSPLGSAQKQPLLVYSTYACSKKVTSWISNRTFCWLSTWHVAQSKKETKAELDTQTETTLKVKFLCSASSLCICGDTHTPSFCTPVHNHPSLSTSLRRHTDSTMKL